MPFFGKVVAEWKHVDDDQIVWRVPNAFYPKIKRIKKVLVKEFERAAFVSKGRVISVVAAGEHHLPKGVSEVIWINVSPRSLPFGIPRCKHLVTRDGYNIGFSGTIELSIGATESDIRKFISKVIGNRSSFTNSELAEWLNKGLLTSVFRDFLSNLTYQEFIKMGTGKIELELIPRLSEKLLAYGLELKSISISGIAPANKA